MGVLSIALIYCGTLFGAGFASGQEIVQFFSCYGKWGIFAAITAGIAFSFLGYVILVRAKENNLHSEKEYVSFLFLKPVARIIHFISAAYLIVSFCIMISGCGTLFYEEFHIRPIFGALFSLLICYKIIVGRKEGLARFNAFVTPLMTMGVLALCIMVLVKDAKVPFVTQQFRTEDTLSFFSAVWKGILYVSYNLISASAVLVSCAGLVKTPRYAGFGGLIGGFFSAVILVLMAVVLVLVPDFSGEQMPFFSLICALYPRMHVVCALILYGAMLTTATSCGLSVLSGTTRGHSKKALIALCVLAFFASLVPFDVLVRVLYTAFGICGLLLLCGILKSFAKKYK